MARVTPLHGSGRDVDCLLLCMHAAYLKALVRQYRKAPIENVY